MVNRFIDVVKVDIKVLSKILSAGTLRAAFRGAHPDIECGSSEHVFSYDVVNFSVFGFACELCIIFNWVVHAIDLSSVR